MTKDEIKKALECCVSDEENACYKCPNANVKGYGCRDKLLANALNLITEQEKEIEKLKGILDCLKAICKLFREYGYRSLSYDKNTDKVLHCLEYKNYRSYADYSDEDGVWYGKIEDTTDLVSWESETLDGCAKSFAEAVDDYIELKKRYGK